MNSKIVLLLIGLVGIAAAFYFYFEPKQLRAEILDRAKLTGETRAKAEKQLKRLTRAELESIHNKIEWGLSGYALDIFNLVKNIKKDPVQ